MKDRKLETGACFIFLEQYLQGQGPLFMVVILGVAMAAAFAAFALSLRLAKATMKTAAPSGGLARAGRNADSDLPQA